MTKKLTPTESLRVIPLLEEVLKCFMDVTDVEIHIEVNNEQLNLLGSNDESVQETSQDGSTCQKAG